VSRAGRDTTDLRVEAILGDAFAEAYGLDRYDGRDGSIEDEFDPTGDERIADETEIIAESRDEGQQ
jgi:hypothetical protein